MQNIINQINSQVRYYVDYVDHDENDDCTYAKIVLVNDVCFEYHSKLRKMNADTSFTVQFNFEDTSEDVYDYINLRGFYETVIASSNELEKVSHEIAA